MHTGDIAANRQHSTALQRWIKIANLGLCLVKGLPEWQY